MGRMIAKYSNYGVLQTRTTLPDGRRLHFNATAPKEILVYTSDFGLQYRQTLTGLGQVGHFAGDSSIYAICLKDSTDFVFVKLSVGATSLSIDVQKEGYIHGYSYSALSVRGVYVRSDYVYFVVIDAADDMINHEYIFKCSKSDLSIVSQWKVSLDTYGGEAYLYWDSSNTIHCWGADSAHWTSGSHFFFPLLSGSGREIFWTDTNQYTYFQKGAIYDPVTNATYVGGYNSTASYTTFGRVNSSGMFDWLYRVPFASFHIDPLNSSVFRLYNGADTFTIDKNGNVGSAFTISGAAQAGQILYDNATYRQTVTTTTPTEYWELIFSAIGDSCRAGSKRLSVQSATAPSLTSETPAQTVVGRSAGAVTSSVTLSTSTAVSVTTGTGTLVLTPEFF